MTIFDRYLLRRYWHVFSISFTALLGMYIIIDVFTNADEFDRPGGAMVVVLSMLEYYAYRSSMFLDMIGGTVSVLAAMVVFTLVQRHGELNPILSAGVPTYRLVLPLLWGALSVNGVIVANQELIIPRIASQLQVGAGQGDDVRHDVEPVYDFATKVLITGKRLHLLDQRVEFAEFILPVPQVSDRPTTLKAENATYRKAHGDKRGGWALKGINVPYQELGLTRWGQKIVQPGKNPDEAFVVSDVGFDRLYKRDKNYEYLSTLDLMRRMRSSSFSEISLRKQYMYLNSRLTRPIINLIVVLLGVPLVARRESRGLLVNLALCGTAMGGVFGVTQIFVYLGRANLLSAELAVWAPVILCGTISAWMSGWIRT